MGLAKRYTLLFFFGLCINTAFAKDSVRVNALNTYIGKAFLSCKKVEKDSLKTLESLEINAAQKLLARYNRTSYLYCQKKYPSALAILDSITSLETSQANSHTILKAELQKARILRVTRKYQDVLTIVDKVLPIAKSAGVGKIEGLCYYQKGRTFESLGKYMEAIDNYDLAIAPLMSSKPKFIGELHKSKGIVYRKMGLNNQAIKAYTQALDNYISFNHTYGIASIYNSMGNLFITEKEYEKARRYLESSLDYNTQIKDGRNIELNISNNLGVMYVGQEKYDSAIVILNKALQLAKEKQNIYEASIAITNLAISYKGLEDYTRSITCYHNAIRLRKQAGKAAIAPNVLLGLGHAHFKSNNLDSANYYYLILGKSITPTLNPRFLVNYYEYIAKYFKKTGQWDKAFVAMDSAASVANRSNRESQRNLIASYNAFFNTKAKAYETQLLEKEIEKEQEALKQLEKESALRNTLFILSLIAFISVSVMVFVISKNKKQVEHSNQKLNEANSTLKKALEENHALMGIVAHDLKTPINQFKGLIELLKNEGNLSTVQTSYLNLMEKVAIDGNTVVNDLVLANKAESLELELSEVSLTPIIQTKVSLFTAQLAKKEIELVIKNNAEIKVNSNQDAIGRILDNLISNAIKFSKKGENIEIGVINSNGKKEVYVKDSGPGIPDKDLPLLFNRFKTLSAKPTQGETSTGLGLYIAKTIAEKINADITVETALSKGSTFSIVFNG